MRKNRKKSTAVLTAASFALFTACNGGGGGGAGTTTNPTTTEFPPTVSNVVAEIPLVGEVLADCTHTGIAVVDSIIDTVNDSAAGSLPTALPTLSEVLDQVLTSVPFIGGLIPGSGSELIPIAPEDLLALFPGGIIPGDLPVLGQLPTVCTDLIGQLPADALTDPAVLLAVLGDPTKIFGAIPVLDDGGNPVGVLLATLPGGLANGGSLPTLPGLDLTQITSMVPLDGASLPVAGGSLDGIVQSLLDLLDTNGLLAGLPGLSGILGLLGLV